MSSFNAPNNVYIGVFPETLSDEKATELGLKKGQGVFLRGIVPDSPAAKAGLRRGDVVLEINGQAVLNEEQFRNIIGKADSGKQARMKVWRDGKIESVSVSPEKMSDRMPQAFAFGPEGEEMIEAPLAPFAGGRFGFEELSGQLKSLNESLQPLNLNVFDRRRLGISSQDLSKQLGEFFNVKSGGVLVTEVQPGSAAEKAGLKAGDCITSVNGVEVERTIDLVRELRKGEAESVTIGIVRDRQPSTVTVKLDKAEQPKTGWHYSRPGTLGIRTQGLTAQLAKSLGVADGKGVLVTEVLTGSAAEKAGLKAGDCITSVAGTTVDESLDISRALAKAESDTVTLGIVRDKQPMSLTATVERRSFAAPSRFRIVTPRIAPMRFEGPGIRIVRLDGGLPQVVMDPFEIPVIGMPEFPTLPLPVRRKGPDFAKPAFIDTSKEIY